jgi:hypothetical protein
MIREQRRAAISSQEQALAEELFDDMDHRTLDDDLNIFSVAFELWIGLTHLLLQGHFPVEELQAEVASRAAMQTAEGSA